jgi:hypothetical protein
MPKFAPFFHKVYKILPVSLESELIQAVAILLLTLGVLPNVTLVGVY